MKKKGPPTGGRSPVSGKNNLCSAIVAQKWRICNDRSEN